MAKFTLFSLPHRIPKKRDTKLMAVTLLILNRFSNFFHYQILQKICSKVFIKDPTARRMANSWQSYGQNVDCVVHQLSSTWCGGQAHKVHETTMHLLAFNFARYSPILNIFFH